MIAKWEQKSLDVIADSPDAWEFVKWLDARLRVLEDGRQADKLREYRARLVEEDFPL